jgi:serine/threonine-protein kinase
MSTNMEKPNRATILFVDDEERITMLLNMMFRADYHVLTASSGQQALELLEKHRVDVLISDQRMPGMTGVELLQQVRDRWPNTLRLLLTGYSDLSAIVGSVNEGEVFRFLNKPWDHDQMRQTIADAVRASRASRPGGEQKAAATVSTAAVATAADTVEATLQGQSEVLLIDENSAELHAMREVLGDQNKTIGATSLPHALAALERRDVGVIVTDSRVGSANMADFLRAVKQHHPVITTVMLTRSADASQVIQLINHAQIYRFITKPMRRSVFKLAVQGAMREHLRLKANPHLTARYQVDRAHGDEDSSPLAQAVARSVSKFKALFGLK